MELNKIYNMDCLEGIKKIADKSINLIVTDPPYFLGMTHNGHKGVFEDLIICKPFYQQLAQEFGRVLKEDGEFYLKTSKNTPILFRWGMNCVPFKLYNLIDYDILSVITDRKAENIWNLTQIIIQYSN